jgi:ADP-heptose:LPS heptosyltransferase
MDTTKPILIIHQGALGDLLLSLPALYSLRLFHGQAPWTMAGNPATLSLLHGRFYAQEVVSIHQKEWAGFFQRNVLITERFRGFVAIFKKSYVFSKSNPENLINGLTMAGLEETVWIPSFPLVEQGISLQSLQRKILKTQRIPWIDSKKMLFPSRMDLQDAREALRACKVPIDGEAPLWAIHPGSGSIHKNWALERFIKVALEVLTRNSIQPIFLLGPVEEDDNGAIRSLLKGYNFPVLRDIPLTVLAGLLTHCAGYLGNDSGVSHLAAALGLPTVVLFGPTDPLFWAPKGRAVRILSSSRPCVPCSEKGRRLCPEKPCLTDLTVHQVMDTILSIL